MPPRLLTRTQPTLPLGAVLSASVAAALTIAALGLLAQGTGLAVLIAAFGASCVIVFTFPAAPLSQPINVVAGHLLSAFVGVLARATLPVTWWSMALAVGIALGVMAALRVTHPPAGGNPLAAMMGGEGWFFLVPVLVGAVLIAVCGEGYRWWDRRAARRAAAATGVRASGS